MRLDEIHEHVGAPVEVRRTVRVRQDLLPPVMQAFVGESGEIIQFGGQCAGEERLVQHVSAGRQHDVLKSADLRADDGKAGRNRFDQDGARGLATGGMHQIIGGAEEFRQVGPSGVEDHAVGDPELGCELFALFAPEISGDEQAETGAAFRRKLRVT